MTIPSLRDRLLAGLPIETLRGSLDPKAPVRLEGAIGALSTLAVGALAAGGRSVLVLTSDDDEALAFHGDLSEWDLAESLPFPSTGVRPFDTTQVADPAVLVQRSEAVERLQQGGACVVTASVAAIMEKIAPPGAFLDAALVLRRDQEIPLDSVWEQLVDQGFRTTDFVDEPGEIARRGGILDVFPFTGGYPVRLEFFGDTLDSIREFDADSQRSISFLDQTRILPDLSGRAAGEALSLLTDYLPADAIVVLHQEALLRARYAEEWDQVLKRAEAAQSSVPHERFADPGSFQAATHRFARLLLGGSAGATTGETRIKLESRAQPDFNGAVKLLKPHLHDLTHQGYTIVIVCDNEGQRDRFVELLHDEADPVRMELAVGSLHRGFCLDSERLAVYTDHQIFNRFHRPKTKRKVYRGGFSLKEVKDLRIGDYVVHVDYGIGKFAGFTRIVVRGAEQEAVVVRYAEDSILYVNVSSLHKLQKYSGKDGAAPNVTKLGSGEWQRKKARTKSRLQDIARDLIRLYAKRKAQRAHAFSPDSGMQLELEAAFEYEETPDQLKAIHDVKNDMMSPTPMDRLVCGDVGFGKTEVAIRAAFKAVNDGKQVAVLVPTTILADQHWKTFTRRMKDLPVTIERVSRFRTTGDISDILKKTKRGEIDILIGTHRLASKDVQFKDLGLLVVDEEQRFGVATKEKLKEFRATVDVLTLTATPIPRTLQFSLMGARDLSVITTPPPNRQPVQTEIHSFDSALIRDAILQETGRNGQVFFIHNRVQNIEEMAGMIRDLVPNVRVRYAHGQMGGPELEKIILDFYDHKFDVLVSTNIVESGIDIANANTILINRADAFGLSELHQLRGRVGRSNRKAFCYLITPPLEDLTVEARKRLLALVEFADLGSGFNIAMRDLDIRGAGDILGAEQSGFINDIGFDLYQKILNDAVRELKETEFKDLFSDAVHEIERPETAVEFDVTAMLEKRYVGPDVERLNLYRELARAASPAEVDAWMEGVVDRFGPMPESARRLVDATRVKVWASRLWLPKVTVRAGKMWVELPGSETEAGMVYFHQGRFQDLLARIERVLPGGYTVTNKDDVVRLVIAPIADLAAAAAFLQSIRTPEEDHVEA